MPSNLTIIIRVLGDSFTTPQSVPISFSFDELDVWLTSDVTKLDHG